MAGEGRTAIVSVKLAVVGFIKSVRLILADSKSASSDRDGYTVDGSFEHPTLSLLYPPSHIGSSVAAD